MKRIGRQKYDFVCSVGHCCATAMYLKRHHMRCESMPFDWIGRGQNGFSTHMDLICRDFKGLMECPNALTLRTNRRVPKVDDCTHDYYHDNGTGVLIYHDFPTGVALSQSFPVVRAKYDRRIARFYEFIRNSRRTLFVYQTYLERFDDALLIAKMEEVRRRLAPAQVDLLVIEDAADMDAVACAEPVEGVYHVLGWFYKPGGNRVLGDTRLCDQIYALIRARGATRRRLRALLLKRWVSLVSRLHWNSRRRRVTKHILARRYMIAD